MIIAQLVLGALLGGGASGSSMENAVVPPSDPRIGVMGRVDREDPARVRMGYPSVTWRLRFQGGSLAMRASSDTGNSSLDVFVDGGEPRVVHLAKGTSEIPLADGAGDAPHTVEVVHRTETWMGVIGVRGFVLGKGGSLLPADPFPRRRMLFVGDSVTCGERIDRQPGETEPFASSNGYLSYGMLLARRLGDPRLHLAFSRHYPGDAENAHPTREQHAAMARDLAPVIREAAGW